MNVHFKVLLFLIGEMIITGLLFWLRCLWTKNAYLGMNLTMGELYIIEYYNQL